MRGVRLRPNDDLFSSAALAAAADEGVGGAGGVGDASFSLLRPRLAGGSSGSEEYRNKKMFEFRSPSYKNFIRLASILWKMLAHFNSLKDRGIIFMPQRYYCSPNSYNLIFTPWELFMPQTLIVFVLRCKNTLGRRKISILTFLRLTPDEENLELACIQSLNL